MLFASHNYILRLILIGSAFLLYFASVGFATQNQLDICHVTGQGKFQLMTIAAPAYDAHMAHGDKPVELFFRDADGDRFGSPSEVITACDVPAGYVEDDTDCDDANPAAYPSAPDIAGNDIIEDCNVQLRPFACPCAGRRVGAVIWEPGFAEGGGRCDAIERGFRVAAGVATSESVRAALAVYAADSDAGEVAICELYDAPTSQLFQLSINHEQGMACVQSLRAIAASAGVQCP
jgi:hypothetical protein